MSFDLPTTPHFLNVSDLACERDGWCERIDGDDGGVVLALNLDGKVCIVATRGHHARLSDPTGRRSVCGRGARG